MPRKIPDLEHTLMKCAAQIFIEKGYAEVSMKDVASAAGTSVGNLYNYFPSKKELFVAGRKIWLDTFKEQFKTEISAEKDPRVALEGILFQLLDHLQIWSGMFEEFVNSASRELKREEVALLLEDAREGILDGIIRPADILIRKMASGNPALQHILGDGDLRFAGSLFSTLKMLVRFYPDQIEENRRYISRLLNGLSNSGDIKKEQE